MEFLQSHTFDVVTLFSVLTVIGQILVATFIICLLIENTRKQPSPFVSWCARHGIFLMLIVAATSTIGSLFFSDIALWTPCKMCWYQRIFMYPQVPLLMLALYKRDKGIAPYILFLSLIGIVFATLHYHEQVYAALHPVIDPNVPCDTSGVSCASTPFFHFGYITIPMMALTAFLLNAAGSIALLRKR